MSWLFILQAGQATEQGVFVTRLQSKIEQYLTSWTLGVQRKLILSTHQSAEPPMDYGKSTWVPRHLEYKKK